MTKVPFEIEDDDCRQCSRCKKILPGTTDFFSLRSSAGLRSWCKQCEREYQALRRPPKRPPDDPTICRQCGESKPRTDEFWPRQSYGDGFRHTCNVCRNTYRAGIHTIQSQDPAFRQRKAAASAAWYAANTERALEHGREYNARPDVQHRRQQRDADRRANDPQFVIDNKKRSAAWHQAKKALRPIPEPKPVDMVLAKAREARQRRYDRLRSELRSERLKPEQT